MPTSRACDDGPWLVNYHCRFWFLLSFSLATYPKQKSVLGWMACKLCGGFRNCCTRCVMWVWRAGGVVCSSQVISALSSMTFYIHTDEFLPTISPLRDCTDRPSNSTDSGFFMMSADVLSGSRSSLYQWENCDKFTWVYQQSAFRNEWNEFSNKM